MRSFLDLIVKNFRYTILILIFHGMSLLAYEEFILWEDPTFGGLKPIPEYSKDQKRTMQFLKEEVNRLHQQLERKMNFISQRKEIINGKFIRTFQAREQYNFPNKERFLTNHKVEIGVSGGGNETKIEYIEFLTRRSRTNKEANHPHTQFIKMRFAPQNEWENLKIYIRKLEPYGEFKDEFGLEEVYDPVTRVKLARAYKNRLIELLNDIELQMSDAWKDRDRRSQFVHQEMEAPLGSRHE